MNDLERKVNSTTDVQEACMLGFTDGYAKGFNDATVRNYNRVKVCNVCDAELGSTSYYLTSCKLRDNVPVEVTLGYCPKCFKKLSRVIEILEG